MRLINTATKAIEQFVPQKAPAYAILSHTWGDDEVTLREYESDRCHHKAGYRKIVDAVRLARSLQYGYLWIDTCCIDKSDSTELTENINSMYRYYRNARVCLAYLADVQPGDPDAALVRSRWFTRGWTLQELVAPRTVQFYDVRWAYRQSKAYHIDALEARTRIPRAMLLGRARPQDFSVARRMAWAAGRETERVEDGAYCLLGIFDVNMPLLYGEGPKAYRRLQEEIVKRSVDLTIFAWNLPSPRPPTPAVRQPTLLTRPGTPPTPTTPSTPADGHSHQPSSPWDPPLALHAPFRLPPLPILPSLPTFSDSEASVTPPATTPSSADVSPYPADAPLFPPSATVPLLLHPVPITPPMAPVHRSHAHHHDRHSAHGAHGTAHSTSGTDTDGDPPATLSPPPRRPVLRHRTRPEHCLFAPSPATFSAFADILPFLEDFENFAVTNRGLFVAGSVYLRTMSRPMQRPMSSSAGNGSGIDSSDSDDGGGGGGMRTIYAMLLGHRNDELVGLPLLKIGPNVFQRDWETDLVAFSEAEAQNIHSVLVTDWYILIDKRQGNMAKPEVYRQAALHVPPPKALWVVGEGAGAVHVFVVMQTAAPIHLWDAQDRVFLRPKPYGWVRYDMVLVVKYLVAVRERVGGVVRRRVRDRAEGRAEGREGHDATSNTTSYTTTTPDGARWHHSSLIVLCRYRSQHDTPVFVAYREDAFPRETELLLMHRAPHSCLAWPELNVMCPALGALSSRVVLEDTGGGGSGGDAVCIRVSAVQKKIDLGYAEADVHSLSLEVTSAP